MGPSPYTIGGNITQASNPNLNRARSTTPTTQDPNGHAPFPRAAHGPHQGKDQRMLYAELQFPVTSNYGSMKKRSQRSSANTNSTTVLSSAGEPSPPSSSDDSHNSTLPVSQSMDNMHRYLPDYQGNPNANPMPGGNRKTAV